MQSAYFVNHLFACQAIIDKYVIRGILKRYYGNEYCQESLPGWDYAAPSRGERLRVNQYRKER
jgi:hypothetical protein